jgi:ABC-type Fe3+ transport system substrate-binding protein
MVETLFFHLHIRYNHSIPCKVMQMKRWALILIAVAMLALSGCKSSGLMVYTDLDRRSSRLIFEAFTKKTGISVNILHFSDVEQMVNAIVTDTGEGYQMVSHQGYDSPDLVLSSDMFTGDVLRVRDALQSYHPSEAETIPAGAKIEDFWYGVGAQPLVLLWNTQKNPSGFQPASLLDLASDRISRGGVCMLPPNYSPYYISAYAADIGVDPVKQFYQTLIDRKTDFRADPSDCAQRIGSGQAQIGLTTLAAALEQQKAKAPVAWAVPDQGVGKTGALASFYSVCLLKNGSHPDSGRQAEEYLLSTDAEKYMVSLGLCNATLRDCGLSNPVVIPVAASLDDASRIYNNDLIPFIDYFQRFNTVVPAATATP